MILKSPTSRLSLVNLFADFILSQIPKEKQTIIQVVDCLNFYVIKGKTSHSEPLDITKLKDEFITKFENYIGDIKLTHTIDLIEYSSKLNSFDSLSFTYHNTENCSYNYDQIESFKKDGTLSYDYNYSLEPKLENDKLVYTSEFPHGYSLDNGRLLYYYGKHIVYNIPTSYPFDYVTLELTHKKDESGDQVFLVKNKSNEFDYTLTSAILDMFDFDLNWLEQEIKKVEWYSEITTPLEEYDFLKKKIKDFIIF